MSPASEADAATSGGERAPPRRRVAFSAGVYATIGAVLAAYAIGGLVLLPWTLAFDRDRRVAARFGSWLVRTALRMSRVGRRLVCGSDVVDLSRPAVVVLCHRSIVDTAVAVALPGAPRLWSKLWVGRIPLMRLAMWLGGHSVFDPADLGDVRDMLDRAEGLLRRGVSVAFFPEGTRQEGPGLGEFSGGAFECAVRAGVDVLPVLIVGTDDMLPRGSRIFREARPVVLPLPRIAPGTDRRALLRRVRETMLSAMEARRA